MDRNEALKLLKSKVRPGGYPILLPTDEWAQPTILGLQAGASLLRDGGRYGAFRAPELVRGLPSAPDRPIVVRHEGDRPQPRRDRDTGRGLIAVVGRVRECPLLDLRLVVLSHNTIRGAAGGALLNAVLLVASGVVS